MPPIHRIFFHEIAFCFFSLADLHRVFPGKDLLMKQQEFILPFDVPIKKSCDTRMDRNSPLSCLLKIISSELILKIRPLPHGCLTLGILFHKTEHKKHPY